MLYCIANKQKAIEHGFIEIAHTSVADKIVLNENELRKINDDIKKAAEALDGVLMSLAKVKEYITKANQI